MAPRGETRSRVLQSAREQLQRHGYHATGLNRILAEAGAPRGSLYFHFPGGKEQLAAEAVAGAARDLGVAITALLAGNPDIRGALLAMAELLAAGLEQSAFHQGCPVATVALDAAADSDTIRDACAHGYEQWAGAIAGHLHERGVDTEPARELADTVLAGFEGALLLARVRRDTDPLRRTAEHLGDLLELKGAR